MTPIIPFLTSPLGIVVLVVAALLVGRFLWTLVSFAIHLALVAAILGVIIYALGGLPDFTPAPMQHAVYHVRRAV